MTTFAVYVRSKESRYRHDAMLRTEFNRLRSEIISKSYDFLGTDDRRYVSRNRLTGKIKTIQEPDWLPLFDQMKTLGGPQ